MARHLKVEPTRCRTASYIAAKAIRQAANDCFITAILAKKPNQQRVRVGAKQEKCNAGLQNDDEQAEEKAKS
jgi:hypothetical protein|tara:strand:- start:132 stop:347 length:216 start_codon:yes stop_codon:yes gene_type:complete